jgi:hypothetical protein
LDFHWLRLHHGEGVGIRAGEVPRDAGDQALVALGVLQVEADRRGRELLGEPPLERGDGVVQDGRLRGSPPDAPQDAPATARTAAASRRARTGA